MSESEFRFGEGRISGVLSVALGGLSLLAVLCFRYPEILTTPDLREVYPIPLLRGVLFVALLLGLLSSFTSLVLSRRRGLGLAGITLCAAAIALGGAWVETEAPIDSGNYLGLDWFVLDLLVLAVIFVPLERLFALRREQKILRMGFRTDLAHFFVSHLLVQVTVLLTLAPATVFFRWAVAPGFQATVAAQPLALQFIEALFLADLFQYGIHRLFHAIPWLWQFHAIHHSSREMDWLAGSRLPSSTTGITRPRPMHSIGISPSTCRSSTAPSERRIRPDAGRPPTGSTETPFHRGGGPNSPTLFGAERGERNA